MNWYWERSGDGRNKKAKAEPFWSTLATKLYIAYYCAGIKLILYFTLPVFVLSTI
jgi:hypothetical protein